MLPTKLAVRGALPVRRDRVRPGRGNRELLGREHVVGGLVMEAGITGADGECLGGEDVVRRLRVGVGRLPGIWFLMLVHVRAHLSRPARGGAGRRQHA